MEDGSIFPLGLYIKNRVEIFWKELYICPSWQKKLQYHKAFEHREPSSLLSAMPDGLEMPELHSGRVFLTEGEVDDGDVLQNRNRGTNTMKLSDGGGVLVLVPTKLEKWPDISRPKMSKNVSQDYTRATWATPHPQITEQRAGLLGPTFGPRLCSLCSLYSIPKIKAR